MEKTERGFDITNFKDYNGADCSLQKSSIATEDCVWLGLDKPDLPFMVQGEGWKQYQLPDGVLGFSRMHLTQQQVKDLLPYLQKFAETGELT